MKKKGVKEAEKPPVEKPAAESIPDYTIIVGLKKSCFPEIVGEVARLAAEIKELGAELKELKQTGAELLIKAKVKSVLVDGRTVTRVDGTNVSLSRVRLIELGVEEKIIEKATKRTPYTTLFVGEVGE